MDTVLQANAITKRFEGIVALDTIDLELTAGQIIGLIGPNGSGKTTLVNVISGLLKPEEGTVEAWGRSITGLSLHAIVHVGISRTFQNLRIFKRRTVLENVIIGQATRISLPETFLPFATMRRDDKHARAMAVLDRFRLAAKADTIAGSLSFGEQKRLELARAMAAEPRMLLLDEPAGGMNPSEIEELKATLDSIRRDGVSILLIEHNMRLVMGICDRIAVLCFGKLIAEGVPDEIRSDPAVIASYLGRSPA